MWYWRSTWLVYAKLIPVYLLFNILFKSERCFPAEHVLLFSWLQERCKCQERRSNSRSIFWWWTNVAQNDDSVQFWNKNVVQAVRTILQRLNAQNGVRTVVLFNYFYRGRHTVLRPGTLAVLQWLIFVTLHPYFERMFTFCNKPAIYTIHKNYLQNPPQ